MNTPYPASALDFTALDEKAWAIYEKANAAAKEEYVRRPSARPHVAGHFLCLCCDILTEQPSSICLSCQELSPGWAELAADPIAIAELRRANKRMPTQLRRVVLA